MTDLSGTRGDVTSMRFPVIDYRTHPAYAAAAPGRYPYDDHAIAEQVCMIDRAFEEFRSLPNPSTADVVRAVSDMKAGAQEILRHAGEADTPIIAREWLGSSIDWAISDLHYECIRLMLRDHRYDDSGLQGERLAQLRQLRTNGMYLVDADERDFRAVQTLAMRFAPELRRRISANPALRAVHGPSRISPLGRAIHKLLSNAGVLDILSRFKGTRMAIMGTGLEYSQPGQAWHAGLYSDVGLPDGPLKYFHVDQADHLPKAMIYATEVTPKSGPTGIIRGSNTWGRSEFLFRAHKGLDRLTVSRYGKYVGGAEYRAAARSPDLRRIFMQLPTAFQGSSHFGDDVLPDSPITRQLVSLEQSFLSVGRKQVLVFDGARALHRGSLVLEGERLAMQVAFKNLNDHKIGVQMDGGTALAKLLRRVRELAMLSVRG
jgi:hypothetical protein